MVFEVELQGAQESPDRRTVLLLQDRAPQLSVLLAGSSDLRADPADFTLVLLNCLVDFILHLLSNLMVLHRSVKANSHA